MEIPWDRLPMPDGPTQRKVLTVEVEGIIDPKILPFTPGWVGNPPRVRGRLLRLGEKARIPREDAEALEQRHKLRIVPGSEKMELVQL